MSDVGYIALMIGFFLLAVLFVIGCDKIIGPDEAATSSRRSSTPWSAACSPTAWCGCTIDLAAQRVTRDGQRVRLTRTEWRIVQLLARNPGCLITHHQLLADVWGVTDNDKNGSNYVRVFMVSIRRKLEPDPAHRRQAPGEGGAGERSAQSPGLPKQVIGMALDASAGAETWEKVVRMDLSREQIVNRLRRAGFNDVADDARATLPDRVTAEVADQFCTSHQLSISILMDRLGASP